MKLRLVGANGGTIWEQGGDSHSHSGQENLSLNLVGRQKVEFRWVVIDDWYDTEQVIYSAKVTNVRITAVPLPANALGLDYQYGHLLTWTNANARHLTDSTVQDPLHRVAEAHGETTGHSVMLTDHIRAIGLGGMVTGA